MKKMIKRIIAIFLTTSSLLVTSNCNTNDPYKYLTWLEDNGYMYCYNKERDYYYLVGDKKENNSSCWIIEPYLNDIEVRYFGLSYSRGWLASVIEVPSLINVEELYLPYNMRIPESVPGRDSLKYQMPELPNKVFLVNNCEDDEIIGNVYQGTNGYALFAYTYIQKEPLREIYFTPIGYEYRVNKLIEEDLCWTEGTQEYPNGEYYFYRENTHYLYDLYIKVCKANTSYMFNYENSPNDDYFFIRDYEYGEKIESVPYEPIREGYTFDGWYKEPECINAWNFETDTLPETLYNENSEEVYQETKLYAKWIENPKEEKSWWDWILGLFNF